MTNMYLVCRINGVGGESNLMGLGEDNVFSASADLTFEARKLPCLMNINNLPNLNIRGRNRM